MDMDDIPNPDELEWLETNGLLPEEDEEIEDYFYPEEEHQQNQLPEPSRTTPPSTSTVNPTRKSHSIVDQSVVSDNQINGKKRSWSAKDGLDAGTSGEAPLDDKRSRLGSPNSEIDEDWLRYSPPSENVEVAPAVVEEEKTVSRFASEIEGDCVPVTGPCGNRVYAKISTVEMKDVRKKLSIKEHANGLISEPINILMEKMEREALAEALQASSESPGDLIHPETPVVSEQLWVEKYAPNSFTELLSDERTNREVLLWLKQWDSCVFGSDIRSTMDDVLSALRRHSSISQHKKLSDMNSISNNRRVPLTNATSKHSNNLDQEYKNLNGIREFWNKKSRVTGPPDQKVLLLCGPPGLGKTTLAHVAAKHCGYRVVEINASDDRSSATIEAKILDVVQMNSVISDARPNCLVIDEIDGALGEGKGAVEVILKMVTAEKKSEVGKGNVAQEEQPGKASSKKRRKTASLSRPVICICNDLFAPALRPLRQIAKVHIFVQPTVSRVVSRLKYICNKEGFRTNSIALTALAEYTECDIRSCLNTLQFLNKKKEILNSLEISSQVVGRKDMSRSAFDVWKEVFQKKKTKWERKSMKSCSVTSSDFDFLHSLISNRGEHELTMDGIHENMLQLHYHDPMMQKTVNCLNILGFSDYLHQYIMRTQQMSLLVYQPSTAIAIHCLIAQIEKPNIEWPKSFQRYRTMFVEKKDVLRCWHNKISPYISRHLSTESFVEDNLSPLLHILSPPTLRPVSLHLQSDREKDDLAQLVDTMVLYGITYKNTKPEPLPGTLRHEVTVDASALAIDPPIDEFINFKGYGSGHSGLSLAMKQVLVHEVQRKKILQESISRPMHSHDESNTRNQASLGEENGKAFSLELGTTAAHAENMEITKDKLSPRQGKASTSEVLSTSVSNGSVADSMKLKAPGMARKPSGGSSCFFERFRRLGGKGSQDPDGALQKQATLERDSRPLLFKFNEGFTNAVKRPVRIRDLLL